MTMQDLFPQEAGLVVTDFALTLAFLAIALKTTYPSSECPDCGQRTDRIHSHYRRVLADLPWQARRVLLRIELRKFRCMNAACPRQIFCDRLPHVFASHARTTDRLKALQKQIGLALGGRPGTRLTEKLFVPTSKDTLLRRAKDKVYPLTTPRVLGVDDFAFRRGQNYGTILVDLEKHRVLDLLPDREAKTLACWLKAHPEVEIVSRDRATAYAQGIREACPQSIQVTDRWHLLKNLREAIERWFDGKREKIRELIQKSHCEKPSINKELTNQVAGGLSDRQKSRREQYKQVRRWHEEGLSKRQIHKRTGLHFRTIDRYLRREDCPNWLPGRRGPSRLDVHEGFIKEQLQQPNQTAQKIHQALRTKDCSIGYSVVKACVRRLKTELGLPFSRPSKPFLPNRVPLPSSRSLPINVLQKSEARSEEGKRILEILHGAGSEFQGPIDLTLAFATLLKGKQESAFSEWLQKVEASSVLELKRFAQGLRNDEAAVRAAVTLTWSNGQVEGQVNRLKSIKRAMFGRAKFDLLKARVICNG